MTARTLLFIALLPSLALAQGPRPRGKEPPTGGNAELKADQPDAPTGFDVARSGIARGKIVPFEYESKNGERTFRATVYVLLVYVSVKKYPVLYHLHGASGDEKNWIQTIHADAILDNRYADKKLAPMLVVMPSSLSVTARSQAGDSRDAKA